VAPAEVRIVEGPVEDLLEAFGAYLSVERGLVDEVVAGYAHAVRPFVEKVLGSDGTGLERLDGTVVIAFVVEHVPRLSPKVASLTVTALRSLLRYGASRTRSISACRRA
jgi:site-specific recombinase XerC